MKILTLTLLLFLAVLFSKTNACDVYKICANVTFINYNYQVCCVTNEGASSCTDGWYTFDLTNIESSLLTIRYSTNNPPNAYNGTYVLPLAQNGSTWTGGAFFLNTPNGNFYSEEQVNLTNTNDPLPQLCLSTYGCCFIQSFSNKNGGGCTTDSGVDIGYSPVSRSGFPGMATFVLTSRYPPFSITGWALSEDSTYSWTEWNIQTITPNQYSDTYMFINTINMQGYNCDENVTV